MNILLTGLENWPVKLKAADVNDGILKSISRKYKRNHHCLGCEESFSDLQTLKKQLSVSHINEIFSARNLWGCIKETQKKNHHN